MYDWQFDPNKPREKWCYYDYLADAVIKSNYKIKTTLENLLMMMAAHYGCHIEDYVDEMEAHIDSIEEWAEDTLLYVEESGGLREFDYWC